MNQPTSKKKKIVAVYVSFYYRLFKILAKILSVILILIIVACMAIVLTEKSHLFNFSVYVVESESMVPTLNKGDAVVVEKAPEYKAGDIITFFPGASAQKTYTHRIVQINGSGNGMTFTTKGDNNAVNDPFKVSQDLIQGKVVKTVQSIGNLVLFMRSVTGIILLIIVPATIFLTLNLQSIFHWLRKIYQDNRAY